ncbi:Ubiquitin--protein ligase [Bertholletia excelsa]
MEITPDNSITDMLKRPVPPEEFKCPISSRLMYDPVVIASGQTFERMWIQKWFDEGHGTCPKTKTKLAHLSMTPNVAMKDLILKWCKETGDTILDPCIQLGAGSCETSFTSIASLSNSMKALSLPMDFSNISLESLDSSYSDSTQFKTRVRATLESAQADNESQRFQSCARTHERSNGFWDKLDELPWESRCKTVEDAKSRLKYDHQAYHSMSLEKFSEPLIRFLRSAHDQHDLEAQRTGIQLLLALVSMDRSSILNLPEEAYSLLASFLDAGVTEEARARKNEVTEDALALLEVLSSNQCCTPKIAVSQAPYSILRILETQIRELLEPAIKILYNLSMSKEICSVIMPSEFIPSLVPLFEDMALASYCLSILKNLCTHPDSRASIAETDGCIASIAKLLEIDSHEVQEHGVYVLLSLCSQRLQYCQLVMDEGVIPALVSISINGSEKGKIFAAELLRLLRDIDYGDVQVCSGPDLDLPRDYSNQSTEKKSLFKASGFLGLKMSLFSKSKTSKKKK